MMRLAIFVLSFWSVMLDGFDIVLMAFAAPAVSREWNLSSEQIGFLLSAALVGMMLGAMFLGSLADRFGRRVVVALALMVAGITTVGGGLVSDVGTLMLMRFLAGLGLGALLAALPTYVVEFSVEKYKSIAVAILMAGSSLGSVLGGLVSSIFIAEYGWRPLFIGSGIVTLVTGLVCLLLPESVDYLASSGRRNALQSINRTRRLLGESPLPQLPAVAAVDSRYGGGVRALLAPALRRFTLTAWVTFFLGFATAYFLSAWTTQLLFSAGMSERAAINGAVVLTLGGMVGALIVGWLTRYWALRLIIATAFAIGGVLLLLLAGVVGQGVGGTVIWLLLVLTGMTINGAFTNLYTVALVGYPAQVRSTGLGYCVGLGRSGAVASPTIAGFLLGQGLAIPDVMMVFALPILLAALLAALLKPPVSAPAG